MGGEIAFKAYTPGQGELLPSHTADALDPSDPTFFVDEVVEGVESRNLKAQNVRSFAKLRSISGCILICTWLPRPRRD